MDAGIDPIRCLNDTGMLASAKFLTCQGIFSQFDGPTSLSPATAHEFCTDHCSSFLATLVHNLVVDCNFTPEQVVSTHELGVEELWFYFGAV